jgi:monothiol glutaredoxin
MSTSKNPLIAKVEQIVQSNPVTIFMKGMPNAPQCGFSARAVEVLRMAGAPSLKGIDVLSDDPLWDALEQYTQWPTVPQIFIHGKFIGGCDIVSEMYERGELQELIKAGSGK